MRKRRQALVLVAVFALIGAAAGLVRGGGSAKAATQPQLIVTGAGAGGGPHVRLFNANGSDTGVGFFAYDPGFGGGVRVGTGDLNSDGNDEIITGAGPSGGPQVNVFKYAPDGTATLTGTSFMAFPPAFPGGAFVGGAHTKGAPDIITGAGPSGGPEVAVFQANNSLTTA